MLKTIACKGCPGEPTERRQVWELVKTTWFYFFPLALLRSSGQFWNFVLLWAESGG